MPSPQKLSHNAQVTMNETAQLLEEQLMLAAAELIATRERIFVCGIGASSLIAQDIQQKWTRLGKIVVFENDYNLLLPQLVKNEKKVWSGSFPTVDTRLRWFT